MNLNSLFQIVFYVVVLLLLAKPLGSHVRAYNKINAITRVFLV